MNILIAANYATPNSGNFIGSMMDLGLKLRETDDSLFFIFPDTENTRSENNWVSWLEKAGFKVYLINLSTDNRKQLNFLKSVIAENNIDILHIHFGLFHNFAMHNRKEIQCKIIVHEHMEYPAGCNMAKQKLKFLARSVYYRFKRVSIISVNKKVDKAHAFTKHWFVPNGLSWKRNITESSSREKTREKYSFSENEKAVFFLGWDLYRKGLDIAIKAVAKLREKGYNAVLAIAGVGEKTDVSKHALDYIIEKTGIDPMEDWIRYISGGEDMFAAHRSMDAYLSASRSEAFSYGILEAISQNVPVAVSNIKGTSWSWEYNKSFVYPVEDANACADAILKALEFGNKPSNSAEILDKYSIEKWCSRIIEIYHKVGK